MSIMRAAKYLPMVGALVMIGGAHAAERTLFDNPDYDVTTAEDYYCGKPVMVTVHSARPELFEADSVDLQRIVDATQAVLAFECQNLDVVHVEGRLAGIPEPVYAGVSARRSGWALATRESIQSEKYQDYSTSVGDTGKSGPGNEGRGFSVANLRTGMSVDEARTTVTDTFGVEPEYDVKKGILTMQTGGCPAVYDWTALSPTPEPGWKCLQAWFTDQRLARIYLLDLVQVIGTADANAVEQHLIERFGAPVYRGTKARKRAWWQKNDTVQVMGWGEVVESSEATGGEHKSEIYTLQAKILPIGDATVVTVTLFEPELRPQTESDSDPKISDLTL